MAWAIITIYISKCAKMNPQQLPKTSKFYSRCKMCDIEKTLGGRVPPPPLVARRLINNLLQFVELYLNYCHFVRLVPGSSCGIEQYYSCVAPASRSWIASGGYLQCDCPIQSYQTTYPYSVSTSALSDHFLNYMSQGSQFMGRNLTMSKLSKELVFLDIFYSDLSYVDIQTTPSYDLLTLVCDIGGALGLILGGTLLTIVEFVQLFVQLFNEIVTSAKFARMQHF